MNRKIKIYSLGSIVCLFLLITFRAISWHQTYVSAQDIMVESASTTPVEVALISTEATSSEVISRESSLNAASQNKMRLSEPASKPVTVNSTFSSTLPTIDQIKDILSYIANCESENNPLAKNKNSSAKGLLQIIDGTWENYSCTGSPYDAVDNMNCGIKIALLSSNFSAWDESKGCWAHKLPDELAIHAY